MDCRELVDGMGMSIGRWTDGFERERGICPIGTSEEDDATKVSNSTRSSRLFAPGLTSHPVLLV